MNELKKLKYGGYEEILEEKMEKIDKQAKVIQWYEKENRHNQEIIIKDIKEIERLNNIINELEEWLYDNTNYEEYDRVEKDTFNYVIKKIEELRNEEK